MHPQHTLNTQTSEACNDNTLDVLTLCSYHPHLSCWQEIASYTRMYTLSAGTHNTHSHLTNTRTHACRHTDTHACTNMRECTRIHACTRKSTFAHTWTRVHGRWASGQMCAERCSTAACSPCCWCTRTRQAREERHPPPQCHSPLQRAKPEWAVPSGVWRATPVWLCGCWTEGLGAAVPTRKTQHLQR